jgi:hypothetical protein
MPPCRRCDAVVQNQTMSNVGHTIITITGCDDGNTASLARLRATPAAVAGLNSGNLPFPAPPAR